jgi:hypothetical protein
VPSIPSEQLLHALLLQVRYAVRSERLLKKHSITISYPASLCIEYRRSDVGHDNQDRQPE